MTTPIAGLRYKTLADSPNGNLLGQDLATDLDHKVIARYATVAARDTANPTPIAGDMCFCSDYMELYAYNGTTWISAIPRTITITGDQSWTSNTTFADYNGGGATAISIALEPNATYTANILHEYRADSAADLKQQYLYTGTFNAARLFTNNLRLTGTTGADTFMDSVALLGVVGQYGGFGNSDALPIIHYMWCKTTTGGTLKPQFAQNSSSATASVVAFSQIMIRKVA